MENSSIRELSRLFREKKLSPVEHAREAFQRIQKENQRLHAFVYLNEEEAMREAKAAESDFMKGIVKSPLQGITVGLKDLICTKDAPVTMECEYYYDHPLHPREDSTVAHLLKESGAVILGKTNTHALGMGATGDVAYSGCSSNPYNLSKVTGGSSSGSSAAMAAGLCDLTFGHDSGGSLRIPASLCGVVGMKPTFGRVSKYGLCGLGLSCDCVGPISGSVEDSAIALTQIAGYDEKDNYSLKLGKEDYSNYLNADITGVRVAVPMNWLTEEPLENEVRVAVCELIRALKQHGAEIVDVSANGIMPDRSQMTSYRKAHQAILSSDGYMIHQEALKQPEKIPKGILERLLAGNITALERNRAYAMRNELRQMYHQVFQRAEIMLTPTVAGVACNIGQQEMTVGGKVYPTYSVYSEFTWQASFSGMPAMSIPCGATVDGLPIGVMLTAAELEERHLYHVGYAVEKIIKNK